MNPFPRPRQQSEELAGDREVKLWGMGTTYLTHCWAWGSAWPVIWLLSVYLPIEKEKRVGHGGTFQR